jgi:crossover junction endodeoxyribonuclease RuvC
MGLDPGTLTTGFGIVSRKSGRMSLVASGTIRNSAERSMPLRLQWIFREITRLIGEHCPDEFAIESAFYGKNAQSALKLGHARGVAILAAAERELPTTEYSPREIKKAVVGNGNASKEQVRFMVRALLGLGSAHMPFDASDAIAIAICHLHRMSSPASASRDWKSYVESHPEKVIP